MPTDRYFIVRDWPALGRHVRNWALGTEPRPATIAALKIAVHQTVLEFGPGFLDTEPVEFLQKKPMSDCMSFVLPAAEDLGEPLPTGAWPLPEFYGAMAFGGAIAQVAPDDGDDFRSARIADYSANRCM